MSNKRLIKSTGLIGFATFLSRVLGFARDVLTARLFGTTVFAETFVVAFRIPNLLRDLVGEGAANAAFVPVLTEYHTNHTERDFWMLARDLLYALSLILIAISALGILATPLMVKLIAPGFCEDPHKLALTISLTRFIFPFVFLIGLVAYGTAILNSLNHFTAPALCPALLNIAMIFFLVYVCPKMGINGLAFSILVGGVFQVAAIWPVLHKKGLRLNFLNHRESATVVRRPSLTHPVIRKIWKLLVPRFFGSAVYQLSVIVDNIFSTFYWIVGAGAPAALWYSYRLFHLPLAIFGIALATAALPKMSQEVARRDFSALKTTIRFSIKSIFFVLIPAGIGLATLGKPAIRILFERGEFTPYSTSITYSALLFYSFGLFACGGIKILVNTFFSLGDTRTPVKTASISLIINIVLNYILMWPLKIGGLALATSISATSNFLMLYILLAKKIGDIGTPAILLSSVRIVAAGTVMGFFSYFAGIFLEGMDKGIIMNIIGLTFIIVLSAAVYVIAGAALGIEEIKAFLAWISRKN
ncbi:MAG: murein biosynthesis integral membrane protein MurJ [Candidatus Omnitrophica bacterium]|nr:murein biosynthesis integral membrane protein MurJ [Candidatus Omnitrophota bacterium]